MKIKLVVAEGKKAGMEIPISRPQYLIGRGDECHLRPQSPLVSQKHCMISISDGSAIIEDCGSATGTLVNGEKIRTRQELGHNDRVVIGPLALEVRLTTGEASVYATQGVNMHEAAKCTVASATILDKEAGLVEWLYGKNNDNGKKAALPVAKRIAKVLLPVPLPSNNVRSLPGEGSPTETLHPRTIPLLNKEKSSGVALVGGKNDDWAAANLLGELNCLLHDSVRRDYSTLSNVASQVINVSHDEWKVSGQLEGIDWSSKEWDETDLLLLAAFGLLLVVVLSWLFPISWPEAGRGPRGWLRWCLQNWWHIWWLRWGVVAILVTVLLKLLRVRARSE